MLRAGSAATFGADEGWSQRKPAVPVCAAKPARRNVAEPNRVRHDAPPAPHAKNKSRGHDIENGWPWAHCSWKKEKTRAISKVYDRVFCVAGAEKESQKLANADVDW